MDWIKKVLDKFESFLKRAFLPSMVFYFFVILFGMFDNELLKKMKLIVEEKNFAWVFIVFSIGLSYFLNMLHQLVFDNNIKGNYDTKCFWTEENNILKELREKVLEKLEKDELNILDKYNDYVLYQIIRGKVKKISKRYVDDAKTYGIVFLSFLMAVFTILSICGNKYLNIYILLLFYFIFLLILSVFIIFNKKLSTKNNCIKIFPTLGGYIIFETIKAKYRSRAIRLYIDYITKNVKEKK